MMTPRWASEPDTDAPARVSQGQPWDWSGREWGRHEPLERARFSGSKEQLQRTPLRRRHRAGEGEAMIQEGKDATGAWPYVHKRVENIFLACRIVQLCYAAKIKISCRANWEPAWDWPGRVDT